MKIFDCHINKKARDLLNSQNSLKPALFLDRDGVIIKDRHYISNPNEVELENFAFELIQHVKSLNWPIIVITNQSGISKGILNWNKYMDVTKKMIDLIDSTNPFTAIYANSVSSNLIHKLRKPSPGMIFKSIKDFPLDLEKSIIIGDRISDIQAGARAGLLKAFHLMTGHGKDEREIVKKHINSEGIFIDNKYSIQIKLVDSLMDIPLNTFYNLN